MKKFLQSFLILSLALSCVHPLYAPEDTQEKSSLLGIDKKTWLSVAFSGAVIGLAVSALVSIQKAIMKRANTQVGVLKINDLTLADAYLKDLLKHSKDSTVKAILIMVNCSEGSIAVANALYNEILTIKKNKPVIALIEHQCSAAGYYIALACDQIVATPLAQISALNVRYIHSYFQNPQRMMLDNVHKSLIIGAVQEEVIHASNPTCTNSVYCALNDQERQAMQNYITTCYEQFCADVAQQRNIAIEQVHAYAQQPLFTGKQASDIKLIDKVGTFSDIKVLIKQAIKQRNMLVTGSLVFIHPKEPFFPFGIFESAPRPVFEIMARMFQTNSETTEA